MAGRRGFVVLAHERDQARSEGNHAGRPASHARSSTSMHGLWKQTAVRAPARKETVRSRFGKILPKRDNALGVGYRASCQNQGKLEWYENRLAGSQGLLSRWVNSVTCRRIRPRTIAGGTAWFEVCSPTLRAVPCHRSSRRKSA